MRTAVVLFTRDLRVHDNLALSTAAHEAKRIVPLFVFDDAILGSAFARPNRVASLLDALRDLDASLRSRGARLVWRALLSSRAPLASYEVLVDARTSSSNLTSA